jgi:hypothetical protein
MKLTVDPVRKVVVIEIRMAELPDGDDDKPPQFEARVEGVDPDTGARLFAALTIGIVAPTD